MRKDSEFDANKVNKRGRVVKRDPKKMRVKVSFEDEGETESYWLDVLSMASGNTRSFSMPDEGDEVWCALDANGEDGCILGSKYNDKDTPPNDTNDDVSLHWEDGSIHLNKGTGALTIDTSGTVKIIASAIELESDDLTHNGTDISNLHEHTGVIPGDGTSGPPK